MSFNFGHFALGGLTFIVCSTDNPIKARGAPPLVTDRKMEDLFTVGNAGHNTTIRETPHLRLDLQNAIGGASHITGYGIDTIDFDNLSLQSGGDSLAVLFVPRSFPGVGGGGAAAYRTQFTEFSHHPTSSGYFLRVCFTWLTMSNKYNRKFCVCGQNLRGAGQAPAEWESAASQIRSRARGALPMRT